MVKETQAITDTASIAFLGQVIGELGATVNAGLDGRFP